MSVSQYREIYEEAEGGSSLFALVNGDRGWLMFLRQSGDAGFSSRNPHYVGSPNATIDYVLSNGQRDEYPASWAVSVALVHRAFDYFREYRAPPPFIVWHNDSGDGVVLESEA
jgi:hypothetical protein